MVDHYCAFIDSGLPNTENICSNWLITAAGFVLFIISTSGNLKYKSIITSNESLKVDWSKNRVICLPALLFQGQIYSKWSKF